MSVSLFHKHARIVLKVPGGGDRVWRAVHRRPVDWQAVFGHALRLLALRPVPVDGGIDFEGGTLRWTNGPLWTTIRLLLPPGSPRRRLLLGAGLLKAARYGAAPAAARRPGG